MCEIKPSRRVIKAGECCPVVPPCKAVILDKKKVFIARGIILVPKVVV